MSAPEGWKGQPVEVLTGPGYGRGWWYFEGELAARTAAADHTGAGRRFEATGRRLEHPVHDGVFGRVWKDVGPASAQNARSEHRL